NLPEARSPSSSPTPIRNARAPPAIQNGHRSRGQQPPLAHRPPRSAPRECPSRAESHLPECRPGPCPDPQARGSELLAHPLIELAKRHHESVVLLHETRDEGKL